VTTVLDVILAAALVVGLRGSLIFRMYGRVLRRQVAVAREAGQTDEAVPRWFKNSSAIGLLGLARVAFLVEQPLVDWVLLAVGAVAATVALAGFSVGCFVFFRLQMFRYRLRSGRAG